MSTPPIMFPFRGPQDRDNPDMVRMLSDEGMSTRAIAPIVGADQKTIVNDRRAAREEFSSPDPAPEFVDTTTGEIHEGRVSNATGPAWSS